MKKDLLILFFLVIFTNFAFSADITVTDASINAGETVNWTADNTYILQGLVFVEDGAVLNIQAGTVIKAKSGDGDNASALVIQRGAKIFADGRKNAPIIFTAESDDIADPNDIELGTNNLWGGLIVLGKASTNIAGNEPNIEGIDPTSNKGKYGGTDDNDNSGVLRYIQIRHGGTKIGTSNEINGLTLGGVGRKTTVEFIEVFNNQDDGIEIFGGTVNLRYLALSFIGDDAFDIDQGWRGKAQFIFAIQAEDDGDNLGEYDGGDKPGVDNNPQAFPQIYNVTYIGGGTNSTLSEGLVFKEYAGGVHANSIFTEIPKYGVSIEDIADTDIDSRGRIVKDSLKLLNNIWWGIKGNTLSDVAKAEQYTMDYLSATGTNWIEDPMLGGISRTNDKKLDPRPKVGSPALSRPVNTTETDGDYLIPVKYIGAFDENNLWLKGWTYLDERGFLPDVTSNVVEVYDETINAGQTVNWTKNNTYVLNGLVFVEDGATLNIEAGTVVKGRAGDGDNASALVIQRGGKIFANGTKDEPIIFTAFSDDVNDANDIEFGTNNLWGGLIILGRAPINISGGEANVEGIDPTSNQGKYGGTNPDDNSGVIRYISIRHGGTKIGTSNEINGLTLGGVGRGTVVEYVEVFNNQDDGIEIFGGTVDIKYAAVCFVGDDAFDYDQGWQGNGQFWFGIQLENDGDNLGEYDGGDKPGVGNEPYSTPNIFNVTFIGGGSKSTLSEGILLKENGAGIHANSIFTDIPKYGVRVEDTDGQDSRDMLEVKKLLQVTNNLWWNIADNTLAKIAPEVYVQEYLVQNSNFIEDPKISGISRVPGSGQLDPRPNGGTADRKPLAALPNNTFFSEANYYGAFANDNWLSGWSYLSELGFFGNLQTTPLDPLSVEEDMLKTNSDVFAYPNPTDGNTKIEFLIKSNSNVEVAIYSVIGDKVYTIENEFLTSGKYSTNWNTENVTPGMYFVVVNTNYGSFSHRVIVK